VTAEYVTAVSAFLTFLVIAMSSIAALVQLRHIRSSNQLVGLLRYTEWWETPLMQSSIKFVRTELAQRLRDDVKYRDELLHGVATRADHPELLVADWVEQAGSYIKYGLLAEDQFLDLSSGFIDSIWDSLEPVVALRRIHGGTSIFENFEFLAQRSKSWKRKHAAVGNYPTGSPRLMTQEQARAIVDGLSKMR
jgi:hypothetical protein